MLDIDSSVVEGDIDEGSDEESDDELDGRYVSRDVIKNRSFLVSIPGDLVAHISPYAACKYIDAQSR